MTVRHCLSLLLLASATSRASAQQQVFSSFRSTAAASAKAAGGGALSESLYKQQRVEYTFPVPVSLAPVSQDGNGT